MFEHIAIESVEMFLHGVCFVDHISLKHKTKDFCSSVKLIDNNQADRYTASVKYLLITKQIYEKQFLLDDICLTSFDYLV